MDNRDKAGPHEFGPAYPPPSREWRRRAHRAEHWDMADRTIDPARHSYEQLAPEYDRRWADYIDATMRLVLERLHLAGHERVLDLACGTGELERRLLKRWPQLRIVGADLSFNMLVSALRKLGAADFIQAEAARLPVGSGMFDIVVCANAFHYFRDPAASLGEMHRVLRPGGALVLVDWCDDYLSCKVCSVWLRWTDPAFFRTYTLADCRQQLEQAGFTVETATRQRVGWIWGMMRISAVRP